MKDNNSWRKYGVNLVVFGTTNLGIGTATVIVLDQLDVLIPSAISAAVLLLLGVNFSVCLYDSGKLNHFSGFFVRTTKYASLIKKILPRRRVVHSFISN